MVSGERCKMPQRASGPARSPADKHILVIFRDKTDASVSLRLTALLLCSHFYRAMHFSAKRGIAIACRHVVRPSVRLSVSPSVTLVDQDHIGWKSWKLAWTISLTPWLFEARRPSTYFQGNMGKFWGD